MKGFRGNIMDKYRKEQLKLSLAHEIGVYERKIKRLTLHKRDITLSNEDIIDINTVIRGYQAHIKRLETELRRVEGMEG